MKVRTNSRHYLKNWIKSVLGAAESLFRLYPPVLNGFQIYLRYDSRVNIGLTHEKKTIMKILCYCLFKCKVLSGLLCQPPFPTHLNDESYPNPWVKYSLQINGIFLSYARICNIWSMYHVQLYNCKYNNLINSEPWGKLLFVTYTYYGSLHTQGNGVNSAGTEV